MTAALPGPVPTAQEVLDAIVTEHALTTRVLVTRGHDREWITICVRCSVPGIGHRVPYPCRPMQLALTPTVEANARAATVTGATR